MAAERTAAERTAAARAAVRADTPSNKNHIILSGTGKLTELKKES